MLENQTFTTFYLSNKVSFFAKKALRRPNLMNNCSHFLKDICSRFFTRYLPKFAVGKITLLPL